MLFSVCFLFLSSPIAQAIQQLSQIERYNLVEQILFEESTELPTQAGNISIDQVLYMPKKKWVENVNRYGIAAIEDPSCNISVGNKLKVRGFSSDATLALVENLTPGQGYGTGCHLSVMFFIGVEELESFDSRYTAILDEKQEKRNLIEQILFEESTELPTQVGNISIGQEIYMPEPDRVRVARDIETIERGGIRSILKAEEQDSCITNKLKVRGFSSNATLALVENLTQGPPGAWCPAGAMFFIDVEELATFDDRYKAISDKNKKRDNLVEQILSVREEILEHTKDGLNYLQKFPAQSSIIDQEIYMPKDEWVEVAGDIEDPRYVKTNLSAIRNFPSYLPRKERAAFIQRNQTSVMIKAGESCIIPEGSKLKVLGSSDMLVLVENLTERHGTFCPSGTMFFMDVEELESFEADIINNDDTYIDSLISWFDGYF